MATNGRGEAVIGVRRKDGALSWWQARPRPPSQSSLVRLHRIERGRRTGRMLEADYKRLAPHVSRVLRQIWDPIGLGPEGPADEYDGYLPGVVALVQNTTVSEATIIAHLVKIEVEAMGMTVTPATATGAARALLALREAETRAPDTLVMQAISHDCLHALWVFRRSDGFYTYEHGVLRHEADENGAWSWWADAGEGRSGLYASAEAAENEARGRPEFETFLDERPSGM